MSSRNFGFLVSTGIFLYLLLHSAKADVSAKNEPLTEFETIISRIRAAASNEEWKQPGWKDENIQATLKRIVESSKTITGDQSLTLPVDWKDIAAATARGPRLPTGMLHVGGTNADVAFASKSIFLIDGSIHISHASDCIVIARGAVDISHANHCLVLAGHHIEIGFDGHGGFGFGAGGEESPAAGSIFLSGGSLAIAHAEGSICCAPTHVDISHANKVRFIASPKREISHQQGCQFLDKASSPISIPQPNSIPSDVVVVKQVVNSDDRAKQLVTVERNGLEYVLRSGGKLTDEKGQPIPSWANWKVNFISDNFVLFTDGQSDVSIRVP